MEANTTNDLLKYVHDDLKALRHDVREDIKALEQKLDTNTKIVLNAQGEIRTLKFQFAALAAWVSALVSIATAIIQKVFF